MPLPVATGDAPLPQKYEAARMAIAECERIDECKNWSDQAAAMASYAKQAKDDSLRVMAVRIQARAIRRCGELLKQIEPRPGTRTDIEPGRGAPTRLQAAGNAGLSRDQMHTALRVAAVPGDEFDAAVESESPPTATQLAEHGRLRRVLTPDPAEERFKAACRALIEFSTFCDMHDAIETAQSFDADDVEMARRCVSTLARWLDRFVRTLPPVPLR